MNQTELKSKLKKLRLKNKNILIIGDIALDQYLYGNTNGLSPEGPYPIVLNPVSKFQLGCSANVANNTKSMFPFFNIDIMGVIGHDDKAGKFIKKEMHTRGIGTDHIFETKKHKTILKTRLVANGISIARWDIEDKSNVDQDLEFKLIKCLQNIAKNYDVIVFSDYNKGVVTDKLVTTAKLNKNPDSIIMVDPKKDFKSFKGVDLIKPNMQELQNYADWSTKHASCFNIDNVLSEVRERYGLKNILLTLSENGMALSPTNSHNDGCKLLPTKAKSVVDTCGCGDVVISAMAGFVSGGFSLINSAELANIAAGISISKHGTSVVTLDEIERELNNVEIR